MGTRIRKTCSPLFEVFAKIERVQNSKGPHCVTMTYPATFSDKEVVDCISKFTFPVSADFESPAVDHFTFVLTDIESKFRFGFCRLSAGSQTCLCILSDHPWYEAFIKLLNLLADCMSQSNGVAQTTSVLELLLQQDISRPGAVISVPASDDKMFEFTCPVEDILPRIPDNRNLMEYYSAIDSYNMMVIFASMLFERRIIVTSRRLSRMTACIHAASSLLYPLYWQQIYIPALPPHLLDFCTAPMPYLIGVHSSLLTTSVRAELEDAVVLDADCNRVLQVHNDLSLLPSKVVSLLTKQLVPRDSSGKPSTLWNDDLSQTFLSALVCVIGDYRKGLFQEGGQLGFNDEAYVLSRPPKFRQATNVLRTSQAFRQFIDGRLDQLNSGVAPDDVFEEALLAAIQNGSVDGKKKFKTKKVSSEISKKSFAKIAIKVKGKGLKTFRGVLKFSDASKSNEDITGVDASLTPVNRKRSGTIPAISTVQMDINVVDPVIGHSSHVPVLTEVGQLGGSGETDDVLLTPPPSDVVYRKKLSSSSSMASQMHRTFVLSAKRDSEQMLDSVLSPTKSLLSDPDLQNLLRKSQSFDDLSESSGQTRTDLGSESSDMLDNTNHSDVFEKSERRFSSVANNAKSAKSLDGTAECSEKSDGDTAIQQQTAKEGRKYSDDDDAARRQNDRVARIISLINSNKLVAPALNAQQRWSEEKRPLSITLSNGTPVSRVKAMVQNIETLNEKKVPPSVQTTPEHAEILPIVCTPIAVRCNELMSSAQRRPLQRNQTILRSTGFAGLRSVAVRRDCLLKHVAQSGSSSPEASVAAHPGRTFAGRKGVLTTFDAHPSSFLDTSLELRQSGESKTLKCGLNSVLVNKFNVDSLSHLETVGSNSGSGTKSQNADIVLNTAMGNKLSQSLDSLANILNNNGETSSKGNSADDNWNTAESSGLQADTTEESDHQNASKLLIGTKEGIVETEVRLKFTDDRFLNRSDAEWRSQTLPVSTCSRSVFLGLSYDDHLC